MGNRLLAGIAGFSLVFGMIAGWLGHDDVSTHWYAYSAAVSGLTVVMILLQRPDR